MTDLKFEYVHDHAIHHKGCDKPAFFLRKFPKTGQQIFPGDCQLLNGATPQSGQHIYCGSCGASLARILTECVRRRRKK